jgi:hypothetical protein
MKVRTSELEGAALDWAVAQCEGVEVWIATGNQYPHLLRLAGEISKNYTPSSDWAQGMPILVRERIVVLMLSNVWCAFAPGSTYHDYDPAYWLFEGVATGADVQGASYLIAGMRCYVRSKLGVVIDVPEELLS